MGTDIHPYIERRINGKWTLLNPQPERFPKDYDEPRIHARNYDVFAILADVRNGAGFAGVKTGEGFNPISKPRGLPHDLSEELKREYDPNDDSANYLGDHSFSWLIFREIFDYDYNQTTTLCGVVNAEAFRNWDWSEYSRQHNPKEWCGDVSGRDVRHVSNAEMRKLIAPYVERHEDLPKEMIRNLFTRIEWTQTYWQCARNFLLALKWATPEGVSYDNLRLVFGFDS